MHDVPQLVGDHGAGFVLVQELENAVGQDDARVGPEEAVGEGCRIAVGDDADRGRREVIFGCHLRHDGVHMRVTGGEVAVVEEHDLVDPLQHQVRDPRADEENDRVDDCDQDQSRSEFEAAG